MSRSGRRTRRFDAVSLVMVVVLLVGLGIAAKWAWDNLGTSWLADRQEAADLQAFTDAHPLPSGTADLRTGAPPVTAGFTTGDGVVATLWVPSWAGTHGVHGDVLDARTPIKDGVTDDVLRTGAAGHFTRSQGPGEVGNFALAGHRRTYGDNFLHIDDLATGDALVVETPEAWFVYEVLAPARLVRPEQGKDVVGRVPAGLPEGGRYITLVSCHSVTDGQWGNDHRIVVHGELAGWLEHDAGLPPQLTAVAG